MSKLIHNTIWRYNIPKRIFDDQLECGLYNIQQKYIEGNSCNLRVFHIGHDRQEFLVPSLFSVTVAIVASNRPVVPPKSSVWFRIIDQLLPLNGR